jgi:hypothetical protein
MKKKSSKFRSLIPVIKDYLEQGYTYSETVELLEKNHSFILSLTTFKSYVYRFNVIKTASNDQTNINPPPSFEEPPRPQNEVVLGEPTNKITRTGISALETPKDVLRDVKISADKYFKNTNRYKTISKFHKESN